MAEEEQDVLPQSPVAHSFSNRNSQLRASHFSDDLRFSMQSINMSDGKGSESNRSSTTIKATNGSSAPTDFFGDDFEKALRRFASERDTFLSDLTLSAGAVVRSRPKARPQRIGNDDLLTPRSAVGSVRRRISFRDMSSMKRQPSIVARNGETPRRSISRTFD